MLNEWLTYWPERSSRPRNSVSLCWVLNNTSYYHAARLQGFASLVQEPPALVEWTDTDELRVLENHTDTAASFRRITLFPGARLADIRAAAAKQRLWNCLASLKPRAVCINGWGMFGSRCALAWCRKTGTPAILMSESSQHDAPRSPHKELLKRLLVRQFSAALVGGRNHADYLIRLGFSAERIFLGYDVVDNGHFAAGARRARSHMNDCPIALLRPYFLACARFSAKKNLTGLLEAFASYRKGASKIPWNLVILGEGELRPQLESMRARLGLNDCVYLPGAVDYQTLPVYYGLAGAFVHPSTTEQWGLVVNEAMASGLPVIVSDRCGCARELVVDGQNGFTFNPYETAALARLLCRISAFHQSRLRDMGERSEQIIARWSPALFGTSLLKAFGAALAAGPKRSRLAPLVLRGC